MVRPAIRSLSAVLVLLLPACATDTDPTADGRVVEQFMAALDGQNFDLLDEILCPNLVAHLAGDDLDRADFVQMARGAYQTFPDFRHDIEEIFATDDRVVLRATDYATHAESGRSVSFGQISIYRVVDGCIAEWWEEYDEAGLNEQLAGPDTDDGD